jgi:hypothetical protein
VLGYYQYHAVPGNTTQVAHLQPTCRLVVAERVDSPQSACTTWLGSAYPDLDPMDSSTPRLASLSRRSLQRHPSSIRAVCVNAHVRIRAGGRSVIVVPTATTAAQRRLGTANGFV